jgi:hypothetical protein
VTYATAAIDLARRVIRDHEKSSTGTVTVIPVIVDDLTLAMPVLDAIRQLTGATWLDSADLDSSVPATKDLRRMGNIRAGLDIAGLASGSRRVQFSEDPAGTIEPHFVPPFGSIPSPGEKTALGLLRAVAHQDLDHAEIGILLYREAVLDLPTRGALWRAAVEWFVDVPHPRLRTLIVVVEGPINVSTHCRTGVGFRYALEDSRLLRRRGRDDLRATAQLIARHTSPFVVFLGAGFSASSRLPLGNALRDSTIKRLLGIQHSESLTSQVLALRFHAWISDRPNLMSRSESELSQAEYAERLTLEQVVRAEVGFTGEESKTLIEFQQHHDRIVSKPGAAVLDLAKILESGSGRIILTSVNFDQLVERNTSAAIRIFASDDEFAGAEEFISRYLAGDETDIPYLKLHGSIERVETCVMNTEQTEQGVGDLKLRALQGLLREPPRLWVYVGASMRDLDLVPVLGDESFTRGVDERWVAPYLVETVADFAKRRQGHWEKTKFPTIQDRLVTETADAFFDALATAWPDDG